MNINALDLNLLKAFSALYAQRNVTRAAATIGLAQPSMSNALARLRSALNDELFVKSPGGMVPTQRAVTLAPQIEAALALIAQALDAPAPFDPAQVKATLTIAAPDNLVLNIAPALTENLARVAPGIALRFVPFQKDKVFAGLDRGEVDLALATFTKLPARFYQRNWGQDRFVVIARKGHPLASRGLTLDGYCAARHLLVSFRPDGRGVMDETLKAMGRTRHIALVLSQFAVVPDIVARTDYLSTIPQSVAVDLAARAGCDIHPLPVQQDGWTNRVLWTAQTNADPAKRFALNALLDLSDRR